MLSMPEYSRDELINHLVQIESMNFLEPEDDETTIKEVESNIRKHYESMTEQQLSQTADINGFILIK